MKTSRLFIILMSLALLVVGCSKDELYAPTIDKPSVDSESVASMTTARADGKISLAVDAPAHDRDGVWIDLDGDGVRAEDGSEDIIAFNRYIEYNFAPNISKIDIYGDITYLGAASNKLTSIDISKSSHLLTLNVPINNLTALDLSGNHALSRLDCSENSLPILDVSQNRELLSLWSFNNELTSLDVSNNRYISFLDCSGNNLTAIDVSNNEDLARLVCYNNQISSLSISKNSKLNRVWIYGNQFAEQELQDLMSTLPIVSKGDLWASENMLNDKDKEELNSKGWEVVE